MASISLTVASIKPLNGAITRRGTAGATLTPGMFVYLDGANGWKAADADALASAQGRGVVVSDDSGSVSFASGVKVDIVVFGPVAGFANMTAGGAVFNSVTAGDLDQSAPALTGDYPFAAGWAESASVLFVNPQIHVPTVNS